MKPYGREKKVKGGKPWKTDVHPKKGYINWWETMCDFLSRSRMKQIWKSEINNMIQEDYDLIDTLLDEPCKECGVKRHNLGAYRKDETDTMWVECFECGHEYDSKIS